MSGAIVTIRVNGNPYQLGCDKGQEAEIEALGQMVDETVSQLSSAVGQIGESRLLVMAAILLAEKAKGAGQAGEMPAPTADDGDAADKVTDAQIAKLENITAALSKLAASLKSA